MGAHQAQQRKYWIPDGDMVGTAKLQATHESQCRVQNFRAMWNRM